MLVQWKLPRINGSLITRFTLQRMRVRPQDEGDSDTSSDDNLTSSSSSDDESETIDAHARDTPVRRTPVGAGGVIISEEDAARARIAAAAKKLAARRAAAAAEVSKAEKTRPVYDEWTTVIEEGDIVEAASIALGVRQREDLALSKLQQASPAEFDDVLRDLLRRDAYGATVRFMRIAMVLRSGRQLTAADIAEHPEEPDVAVIMRDVPPGSHYQFRVKVLNSLGWSDWNDADAVTRQNGV